MSKQNEFPTFWELPLFPSPRTDEVCLAKGEWISNSTHEYPTGPLQELLYQSDTPSSVVSLCCLAVHSVAPTGSCLCHSV